MGAQKTEKAVNRATSAACGLQQIIEQFDKVSNVLPESTAHTYQNAESDIRDMIQILQDLQVFDKKPGRAHPSFSSLPHSAFENIDITKLGKWMKVTKKKLEKIQMLHGKQSLMMTTKNKMRKSSATLKVVMKIKAVTIKE